MLFISKTTYKDVFISYLLLQLNNREYYFEMWNFYINPNTTYFNKEHLSFRSLLARYG